MNSARQCTIRGVWGHAPPANFWLLGPLRLILMQSGPIWEVQIAIIFHFFSMTRSCSLQNLLADLGVNVILVITLAKHCSYIYNFDSYCFKIGTLNSPRGGRMSPPPKRNPGEHFRSSKANIAVFTQAVLFKHG